MKDKLPSEPFHFVVESFWFTRWRNRRLGNRRSRLDPAHPKWIGIERYAGDDATLCFVARLCRLIPNTSVGKKRFMKHVCCRLPRFRAKRPWLSGRVPGGYWDVRAIRVLYLEWLGQHLGFVGRDDWYEACNADFIQNHGGTLLQQIYGSSVYIAMQDYQPRYEWIPWLFSKTPKGFWQEAENRRVVYEWLGGTLQIGSEEDWYQVTKASFHENGGAGLLQNYFQGSHPVRTTRIPT